MKSYIVPFVVYATTNMTDTRRKIIATGITPSHMKCESLANTTICKILPLHEAYGTTCRTLQKLSKLYYVDCHGDFSTYF